MKKIGDVLIRENPGLSNDIARERIDAKNTRINKGLLLRTFVENGREEL